MSKYHKINAPWKRNMKTGAFLSGPDQWTRPEFGLLADIRWNWSEKLNGTNIRVILTRYDRMPSYAAAVGAQEVVSSEREIAGRTDRAELPKALLAQIDELLPLEKLLEHFEAPKVVLYGEGVGPKIQKGGGLLSPSGPTFVLFDVRIGETWLTRAGVNNVANELDLLWAPEHGTGTLWDAADYVKRGFVTELPGAVAWAAAEGLVLRPEHELLDRRAHRIITKVKTKDFQK